MAEKQQAVAASNALIDYLETFTRRTIELKVSG